MKNNQIKAGVILSYLTIALGIIISVIYTPIMLVLLGQSEYGLYQLVSSVVSYLSLITLGFGSSYIRFFAKFKSQGDKAQIAKLNGLYLTVFAVAGLIALVAGGILTTNIQNIFSENLSATEILIAKVLMLILVINISLSFPFSVFSSYITANENHFFLRLINLIKTITTPFITLPVLLMGFGSIGMVGVTTFINITIELIFMFYCFKRLKMKVVFKGLEFSLFKEIASFSFFVFINIIVDQINWNVDKFLLGMFHGTVAVAIYGIAAQINTYYLQFSTIISSVFTPTVNKIAFGKNAQRDLNSLFVKVGRIQFIILSLLLSGIYFFGKEFIILWVGPEYVQSYLILLILITPVIIPLIQTLGIEIQRAKNLHKFRAKLYLAIAIINVLISIPLTKQFSGVGSAIGTAIALFVGNGLIMNIYYHKKCGLDIISFWREILKFVPSLILPLIFGTCIMLLTSISSWLTLALYISVYLAVFLISMYFLGLNHEEKHFVIAPIKKIFRR